MIEWQASSWRALRSRMLLVDGALATVLAVLGVVALQFGHHEDAGREPNVWAAVLVVIMAASLTVRRRWPAVTLAASSIALAVYQIADFPSSAGEVALLVAVYSVAAHGAPPWRRRAAIGFFAFLVLFIGGGLAFSEGSDAGVDDLVGNTIVFGTAYLVGDNVRRRRERVADLEERARRLEHERVLEARNAASRERASIARELHDVVAHSMTVMVVQAAAARRVLASDPEQAERSIRAIEDTGRTSLTEMRRILGVLRHGDEAPEMAPQPGIDRIDDLLRDELTSRVQFSETGDPRPLPTVVDVSAYRIVQEALTNVRKHAGPARVRVALNYASDALEIRVDDDGLGSQQPRPESGAGHGLTGMRERAALCGGALASGPRRGGGWSVVARLPYDCGVAT